MASNATLNTPISTSERPIRIRGLLKLSALEATSIAIFGSDVIAVLVVTFLSVFIRHLITPRYQLFSSIEIFPFLLIIPPAFFLQDLYPGLLIHPAEEMKKVFSSLTIAVLLWASFTFLTNTGSIYSRAVFLFIWASGPPVIMACRYFTRSLLSQATWWGVPTVIFGSGPAALRVFRLVKDGRRGLRVKGVLSDEPSQAWPECSCPILGQLSLGPELAQRRFAQYAIVAMSEKSNTELRRDIQEYCKGFSRVLLIQDMIGLCSLGIRTRDVGGEIGLEFDQRLFSAAAAATKRLIDVFLCVLAIFALLPILVLVTLLVKLTSTGPIFFGHVRYGLDGSTFRAWKFRTMVPDADSRLADYLSKNPESLIEWQRHHKLRDDPRVTWVGKKLRRLSLDELPQLLNVLMGQMSLVGPRPIVESEIQRYGRGYSLYRRVKPGITGLWQVSGRNNTTYEERVLFDEFYVHNWSLWLDVYILIRTVRVLVTAEGAY